MCHFGFSGLIVFGLVAIAVTGSSSCLMFNSPDPGKLYLLFEDFLNDFLN